MNGASDVQAAPVPTAVGGEYGDGAPSEVGGIYLDLAVALLPGDAAPSPTDMNGFIFDVADAAILADPAKSWWEGPANLPFSCPDAPGAQLPCRITLGPVMLPDVDAGRPILVRTRPTSDLSYFQTVITALAGATVGDGNTVAATAFVSTGTFTTSQPWLTRAFPYQSGLGGLVAFMTDTNGQPIGGARLALVDPRMAGPASQEMIAAGLSAPGWGTVSLDYADQNYYQNVQWTPDVVSPAVFATTPLMASHPRLPAAWVGIKDGSAPQASDIVWLDLVPGNLIVLPLVLKH